MVAAYPLAPVRYKATNSNGQPLIGGKVYAYVAGSTTTPKDTYSDKNMGGLNTWPVILDEAGSAAIYISGDYYFRIFDAGNVLVEEGDGIADPKSVAQAIFAAGPGTGNLESRVTDLETSRNEHVVRLNTLNDTTADLQAQITAEPKARDAAITAAINSLRTELQNDYNAKFTTANAEIVKREIKVGSVLSTLNDFASSAEVAAHVGYTSTWVKVGDGRYIAAAGTATDSRNEIKTLNINTTGGEYQHVLSKPELPKLSLKLGQIVNQTYVAGGSAPYIMHTPDPSVDTSTVGGDLPHNNMPPYFVMAFWKRTA